jgi:hypothetical protein
MHKSVEVGTRAWKYAQERGSRHESVEVCIRAWKYA